MFEWRYKSKTAPVRISGLVRRCRRGPECYIPIPETNNSGWTWGAECLHEYWYLWHIYTHNFPWHTYLWSAGCVSGLQVRPCEQRYPPLPYLTVFGAHNSVTTWSSPACLYECFNPLHGAHLSLKKWPRNSGHPPSRKTIFEHVLRTLKNASGVGWDIYCAKYEGGFMGGKWHEMSWSHRETSTTNPMRQIEINTE